jgi:hypothetical protein
MAGLLLLPMPPPRARTGRQVLFRLAPNPSLFRSGNASVAKSLVNLSDLAR